MTKSYYEVFSNGNMVSFTSKRAAKVWFQSCTTASFWVAEGDEMILIEAK